LKETIYIALSAVYGWTVPQIRQLTPYQQVEYYNACSDSLDRRAAADLKANTIRFRNDAEYQRWRMDQQAMKQL